MDKMKMKYSTLNIINRSSFVVGMIITLVLCFLPATKTSAHPGSGIVVDKEGNIYFTDTGKGVWKIDKQG